MALAPCIPDSFYCPGSRYWSPSDWCPVRACPCLGSFLPLEVNCSSTTKPRRGRPAWLWLRLLIRAVRVVCLLFDPGPPTLWPSAAHSSRDVKTSPPAPACKRKPSQMFLWRVSLMVVNNRKQQLHHYSSIIIWKQSIADSSDRRWIWSVFSTVLNVMILPAVLNLNFL